ncbi:MAG: DUF2283 domain-containing protein [Chitinivibrionales bacterium]|nr:DUF2283 domain-containing protein [Chitinivibrionales bacterium]MBD3395024.1 DUF2283 domain-containing protein [Chitinivibrionales bacterium]
MGATRKLRKSIYVIRIRDNKIARSEEAGPNGEAIVELDSRGQVVGIEMLEPGHITVREFRKIAKHYDIDHLQDINIDRLTEAFA